MEWALVIVGVLLADLLVHVAYVRVVLPMFEAKPPFRLKETAADPDAQRISFPTTHELTLRGSLHRSEDGPARGLIVFCPEMGATHWSARFYCQGLLLAGYDVLAFDFRSQGESDRMPHYAPLHWLTDFEVQDVLAAIKFVENREDLSRLPLGLFGVSRGGNAALAAAALSNRVRRVATDSAFSTDSVTHYFTHRWRTLYLPKWALKIVPEWHVGLTMRIVRTVSSRRRGCRYTRLEPLLSRLRTKGVLMISGTLDSYVVPATSAELYRRTGSKDGQLWIVPGAKHNEARTVTTEDYDACLTEFFDEMAVQQVPVRQRVPEAASRTSD